MKPLELLVLMGSIGLAPAYLCRLNVLRMGWHQTSVVLFHALLFVGCIVAGAHAWDGRTSIGEIAAVAAAGLWIAISYPTWRAGYPPKHVSRDRQMTQESEMDMQPNTLGKRQK